MWKGMNPFAWLRRRIYERTLPREKLYPWTNHPSPHAANVPGDFYVVDGCCTMCEVPFSQAPELFGEINDERGYPHCYVKKQPASEVELNHMLNAIQRAEFRCIRYHGKDARIVSSLKAIDELDICDYPDF